MTRLLAQLGLNRRRFIDPNGDNNREPQRIIAARPGHMVHIDVKKVGRIPDGGGWRVHGRGSPQTKAVGRAKTWFAEHGITSIERIVTDNGACYRSHVFAAAAADGRHQRVAPYTPRHNGKIERYNRIVAEEFLYARTWSSEDARRKGLDVWNLHYNYHRPHGAHHGQPPASATPLRVNNVLASYN